ncbi:MAG: transposase [Verrucomicrobiota bacterium]|nr:transposase [Verrucomicrobiota bacterium]
MNPADNRFPRRPLRLERVFAKHRSFYFVTFNTSERLPILDREEVHDAFCNFSHKAHEQYDVAIGLYVIMPDHIHLFVALPLTGIALSRWIQSLQNILGKALLRLGFQKPHWQEGFFDHLLRNADSYSDKWDYVRMNPVRAALCKEPEDWTYQGEIVSVRY